MYDKFFNKKFGVYAAFFVVIHTRKGISGTFFLFTEYKKYDILSFTVCVRVNERFFVYIVEKRTFTHSGVCVSGRIHLE